MYGADPLGVNSWRFQQDEAGYGVSSDLLSHAVDLALMLIGPITRVVGTSRPTSASGRRRATAPATTAAGDRRIRAPR